MLMMMSQAVRAKYTAEAAPEVVWSSTVSGALKHTTPGKVAPIAAVTERSSAGDVTVYFEHIEGASAAISADYEVIGSCRMVAGVNFTAVSGTISFSEGEFGWKSITIPIASIPTGFSMLTVKLTTTAGFSNTVRNQYSHIKFENGDTPDATIDSIGIEVNNVTGNDTTGDGTTSAPYASITKAFAEAESSGNHLIRVKSTGTPYKDQSKTSGAISGGVNCYDIDGSESSPIIVTAYAGERPIIDQEFDDTVPSGAGICGFYISGSSHIFINRFYITGADAAIYTEGDDAAGRCSYITIHDVIAQDGGTPGVVASNVTPFRYDGVDDIILSKCRASNWYTGQTQGADIYTGSGEHLCVGFSSFYSTKAWVDLCHGYHLLRGFYMKQSAGGGGALGDATQENVRVTRSYFHDCIEGPAIASAGASAPSPKYVVFSNCVMRNNGFFIGFENNVGDSPDDQGGPAILHNNTQVGANLTATELGATNAITETIAITSANFAAFNYKANQANITDGSTITVTLPDEGDITFNEYEECLMVFEHTGTTGTLTIACASGQEFGAGGTSINLTSGQRTTLSTMSTQTNGTTHYWTIPDTTVAGVGLVNVTDAVFYSTNFSGTTTNIFTTRQPTDGSYVCTLDYVDYNNHHNCSGNFILDKDGGSEVEYNRASWISTTGHDANSGTTTPVYRDPSAGDWYITNMTEDGRFGRCVGIEDTRSL